MDLIYVLLATLAGIFLYVIFGHVFYALMCVSLFGYVVVDNYLYTEKWLRENSRK